MIPPGKRLNKENNGGCLSIQLLLKSLSQWLPYCVYNHIYNCFHKMIIPFDFGSVTSLTGFCGRLQLNHMVSRHFILDKIQRQNSQACTSLSVVERTFDSRSQQVMTWFSFCERNFKDFCEAIFLFNSWFMWFRFEFEHAMF